MANLAHCVEKTSMIDMLAYLSGDDGESIFKSTADSINKELDNKKHHSVITELIIPLLLQLS